MNTLKRHASDWMDNLVSICGIFYTIAFFILSICEVEESGLFFIAFK